MTTAAQSEQAVRLDPADAETHNNLANMRLRQGRTAEALDHYAKAGQFAPDDPESRFALAAAYAAAGRFDDAIATAQKVIEFARAAGQPELVREIAARLQLYREGRPYRL